MPDPIVKTPTAKSRILGGLSLIAVLVAASIGGVIGREGTKVAFSKVEEVNTFRVDKMREIIAKASAQIEGTMVDEYTRMDKVDFNGENRAVTYRHSMVNLTMDQISPDFASLIKATAQEKLGLPGSCVEERATRPMHPALPIVSGYHAGADQPHKPPNSSP